MKKSDTVSKELLLRLYVDERKPTEAIGEDLGMSGRYVRTLLKKFGIETLDRREEHAARLKLIAAANGFQKGVAAWSKGLTKLTHPSIAQCAAARIGQARLSMRGEKHHLWNGGSTTPNQLIRRSKSYKRWRDEAFARDNFICVDCNHRGGSLHAHHLLPFSSHPELRLEPSNGITLCIACHSKRHPDKPDLKNRAKNLEHRLSLSAAQKLVWADPEYRARHADSMKAAMTDDVRRKIRESRLGSIPWNKGLTKKDSPGLVSTGKKNRERMKGKFGKDSNVWKRWHPDD